MIIGPVCGKLPEVFLSIFRRIYLGFNLPEATIYSSTKSAGSDQSQRPTNGIAVDFVTIRVAGEEDGGEKF